MKPSFIIFVVVVLLGFVAGFYYHEALNEKIRYERDTCYEVMSKNPRVITNQYMNIDLNESVFSGGKSGGAGFEGKW